MYTTRRIVVPLSDHPYYLWQALVQAVELYKMEIPTTYLVYTQGSSPSDKLRKIMDSGLADWHVWSDWRTEKTYNAAMKPALVGKWLIANPHHRFTPITIIDPDAIPTREPKGVVTPSRWVGTNTDSYTGADYIKSKPGIWEMLCEVVGVNPVETHYTGVGAQISSVGQTGEFWETIANKSIIAYHKMLESDTDVQAWCSEMYITSLECIRRDIMLLPDPAYSMVWANGPASGWQTCGFYHSAGVTTENNHDFCKLTHQLSPWGKSFNVHPNSASHWYVELIHNVKRQYPELVW
jgi:hypothetical protein